MKRRKTFFPITTHPLRARVKRLGITLPELREALQGRWDEVEISMMLWGAEQMPAEVETVIEEYLGFVKYCPAYDEISDEVSNIVRGEIR